MNRRTIACLSRSLLLIVAGVLLLTASDDTNVANTNTNSNAGACLNPDVEQKFETAAVQSCRSRPTWRSPSTSSEDKEFGDQFGGKDNWLKLYKEATPKKYDFAYMKLTNPPEFYKNFEKQLYFKNQ